MCFEDIEIGQATPFRTRLVSVPQAVVTVIAPRDPMRSILIIGAPFNNWVYILPDMDPTPQSGYLLASDGTGNQIFTLQEHGRMVQAEWRAIPSSTNDEILAVIEGTFGGLQHRVGANRNG